MAGLRTYHQTCYTLAGLTDIFFNVLKPGVIWQVCMHFVMNVMTMCGGRAESTGNSRNTRLRLIFPSQNWSIQIYFVWLRSTYTTPGGWINQYFAFRHLLTNTNFREVEIITLYAVTSPSANMVWLVTGCKKSPHLLIGLPLRPSWHCPWVSINLEILSHDHVLPTNYIVFVTSVSYWGDFIVATVFFCFFHKTFNTKTNCCCCCPLTSLQNSPGNTQLTNWKVTPVTRWPVSAELIRTDLPRLDEIHPWPAGQQLNSSRDRTLAYKND